MMLSSFPRRACIVLMAGLLFGCGEKKAPPTPKTAAAEVTAITVAQRDAPVAFDFVAQTQSSREVEIRARCGLPR